MKLLLQTTGQSRHIGCDLGIIWFAITMPQRTMDFSLFRSDSTSSSVTHANIFSDTSSDKCMLCSRPVGTVDENG